MPETEAAGRRISPAAKPEKGEVTYAKHVAPILRKHCADCHHPGGPTETIPSVRRFDFNWLHTYRLKEPLKLPQWATIRVTAHFDNSADNPANPDPRRTSAGSSRRGKR